VKKHLKGEKNENIDINKLNSNFVNQYFFLVEKNECLLGSLSTLDALLQSVVLIFCFYSHVPSGSWVHQVWPGGRSMGRGSCWDKLGQF
jgi:hypothetical protein